MNVCIYADSTDIFSEEFCNIDNLIEIEVENELLFEYFRQHCLEDFRSEDDIKQGLSERAVYEEWLDEYTADDTDELWEFLMRNGKRPKLDITLV